MQNRLNMEYKIKEIWGRLRFEYHINYIPNLRYLYMLTYPLKLKTTIVRPTWVWKRNLEAVTAKRQLELRLTRLSVTIARGDGSLAWGVVRQESSNAVVRHRGALIVDELGNLFGVMVVQHRGDRLLVWHDDCLARWWSDTEVIDYLFNRTDTMMVQHRNDQLPVRHNDGLTQRFFGRRWTRWHVWHNGLGSAWEVWHEKMGDWWGA